MIKSKPIYTYEEIQAKVEEAANWIQEQNFDSKPIMIGILNGCIRFYADLMTYLEIDTDIDFLAVSSYDGTTSTNTMNILKKLKKSVEGKHVIVIEDIVDGGQTISFIDKYLKEQNPKSISYVVLVTRENHKSPVNIDHVCLQVQDQYIVGYGFDANEQYRNLNGIFEYISN